MILDTDFGPREVHEKTYWHVVSTKGPFAMTFYNNVMVHKGELASVSAMIQAEPHLDSAQTGYSLSKMNDEKEILFERIRDNRYPSLPPRLKSFYVFDDYALVERAMKEWFQNEARAVHECRVLSISNTHKADTVWLNCAQNKWDECANNYWAGLMSEHPFPEIIVHGAYFGSS